MAKLELKAKPKAKTKMEFWTPTEKENTKTQYGCEILMTNVTFKEAMTTMHRMMHKSYHKWQMVK